MKATLTLHDFQTMNITVQNIMGADADPRDPMNGVTIEYESTPGGYSLFVSVNKSINGVHGTFRTEIFGDE